METISHSPRVFHLHNFLTEGESDALVAHALADRDAITGLQRSTTGAEHQVSFNKIRTSDNAFDSVSPAAMALKRRAIDLLGMAWPYDDQMTDGLQVLRYNTSRAYIAHLDYLDDNDSGHDYDSRHAGSNRFATILFYLSDVEEGGETVFAHGKPVDDGKVDALDGVTERPALDDHTVLRMMEKGEYFPMLPPGGLSELDAQRDAQREAKRFAAVGPLRDNNGSALDGAAAAAMADPLALFEKSSWEYKMVAQCRARLSVRPKKAHAVLFYSQHPDGSLDKSSKHGGCPVLKGTKWAANLWIWNRVRLGYPRAPRKQGAAAYDSSRGIGRDRMVKDERRGGGGGGHQQQQQQQQPGKQPVVQFNNRDVQGAKLYFQDTFMGDLPVGGSLSFNTFEGHAWNVRDGAGNVVHRTTIDARPQQMVEVARPAGEGGGGGGGGGGVRPPRPPRPPNARPPA